VADSKHLKMLETARELDRSGQSEPALEAYRRFLIFEPRCAEGWADFGGLLMVLGRLEEATEACDKALQIDRTLLGARVNSACILMHQGRLNDAEAHFREILAAAPRRNDAHLALAECLVKKTDFGRARTVLEEMIEQDPADLPAHQMLGHIFHRLGQWPEYQQEIDRRLSVVPSCAYVEYERGYLELLFGKLPEGWARFESRWRVPRLTRPKRNFSQPRWNGESFVGKTLLLYFEQGFGDTMMFVRFAPLVKALGGTVILEAQAPLADLVATCPGIDEVIPYGNPLPPFDLQMPLLSLPGVFHTDLTSIPCEIPYLDIPERVPNQEWITRILSAAENCTRIGLVWSGSPAHRNDVVRSIPTATLHPLTELPNTFWFDFQLGPSEPPPFSGYVSLAPWLSNFSDTAYALSGMDLVITVDTALAHLAGALGIPTLLLLPFSPDWRWMLGRNDSPWYPSMHIYRQSVPGDWDGVIQQVLCDLNNPS